MAEPLNSNLELNISNVVNGLSCKSPQRPSAANGSIGSSTGAIAAVVVVGRSASATASTPRSSSSMLAFSTISGAAAGSAGAAAGGAEMGVGDNMALPKISTATAAAGAGLGATPKSPISNKSISAVGAGGGAGAATGAAAGGAATDGAGRGAGAGAGGGTDPGTIPPKSAAACRSYSNCSGVFCTGAGAGAPNPLLPS